MISTIKDQHNKEVVDLINSEQDRDIQEELLAIHKNYSQVLAGLRIATNYLSEIDETTGTDHSEMIDQIFALIKQTKVSEIGLLEMASFYNKEAIAEEATQ